MNLKEAKQFVAHFVKGDYAPEEYAIFLRWLKGATLEELNEIADEHELLHEHWDITSLAPTAEWKARLEGRLDREEVVPMVVIGEKRTIRFKAWVAAASVVALVSAGAIWYSQEGGVKATRVRPELSASAKTVVNPSGSAAKELILGDGSKVLLNVASTLKYPEIFTGAERVVELSGEAYFEVKPDAAKPFRVLIKDAEVDVLGTNFNVRAYANEPVSKTTLIEGSVEMQSKSSTRKLTPGEQGIIAYASAGEIAIVPRVDVGNVMEWKKGYFVVRNEEFATVARVLERYFNVEIQCDPAAAVKTVSGSVSRYKPLDENLNQFESLGLKHHKNGTIMKVTL
jgi:ferric-dicitrate binding protein FerR (iron transport regulator)